MTPEEVSSIDPQCNFSRDTGSPLVVNVLLGVTGSVAAVKVPELICRLLDQFGSQQKISIKVVLTRGGQNFWEKASTYDAAHWNKIKDMLEPAASVPRQQRHLCDDEANTKSKIQVYYSADEWSVWNKIGDPVEHIVLRDWATFCVIAPLSAHSLAKFAHGMCDDTLSCIVRAWKFGPKVGKPLILAPAMNVAMWEHPLTAQQLNQLTTFGTATDGSCCVHMISPQEKMLACGDIGIGAMADVSTIVDTISMCLDLHPSR